MYTDVSLVTSAPTGSGKTVIFELAIIRLLMQSVDTLPNGKIIYGKYNICLKAMWLQCSKSNVNAT